ncbi:MAG TPA: DUF421 domain-containing protein, partial [Blastocatellia bacterium]|nr:DUF421 domain-containing protein [Blastocatellia bacterium]
MKGEHVHEVEILTAVRAAGLASLDEVEAVVLEPNSNFSVVQRTERTQLSTLVDVSRSPHKKF